MDSYFWTFLVQKNQYILKVFLLKLSVKWFRRSEFEVQTAVKQFVREAIPTKFLSADKLLGPKIRGKRSHLFKVEPLARSVVRKSVGIKEKIK